jgi:anti-sigma B factor antagonist
MGEQLTIHVEDVDGQHVLRLVGEVDVASAAELLDTVRAICAAAGAKSLYVDLRGVEFMDSSGLRALLETRALCQRTRCSLSLSAAGAQVQRLFEITGAVDILPLGRLEPSSAPSRRLRPEGSS